MQVTHAEQMKRIARHVAVAPRRPRELRFVTWTLKYNRCHWLEVLRLEQHYARAELSAKLVAGVFVVAEPRNITRFAITRTGLPERPHELRIGEPATRFPLPNGRVELARVNGAWRVMDEGDPAERTGKRPGLQGPIDDAFTTPFLCV